MRRTLILKIEKRPTVIVGLGNLGVAVVDSFFELIPAGFKRDAPYVQVTPAAAMALPEGQRPRGMMSTVRTLVSLGLGGNAVAEPSADDSDAQDSQVSEDGNDDEGAASEAASSALPSASKPSAKGRSDPGKGSLRAIIVSSPFEELSTTISRVCSYIEEDALRARYGLVEIDYLLLADLFPGPATRRKADNALEDLITHMTTRPDEQKAKATHTFFWVDHTNERGVSLRKDPKLYRSVAISALEGLVSPLRAAIGAPSAAGLERLKEATPNDIPVSTLGRFAVEVPVDSIARVTLLRRLSAHLSQLADTRAASTPERLIKEIEKAISLNRERFARRAMKGPATDAALRLAQRLRGLPAARFILGGDPDPELSTVQAGLENLLNQARWQVASSDTAQNAARQQITQVEGILDKHVGSSAAGLGEGVAAIKTILDSWRTREAESFGVLDACNRHLEQLGRRVAWLSEENARRSQRSSWKNPVTSVMLKSVIISLGLGAGAFAAAWFLPGMREILPGLVGATAGGSFLTAMLLFMAQNFKERGVIPELLHETGAYAERKLDVITEEEYLKYLRAMNTQLETLGAELHSLKERIERECSAMTTEASTIVKTLGVTADEYHRVYPTDNSDILTIGEKYLESTDGDALMSRICPTLPRGRDDIATVKENALRFAQDQLVPRLRSDTELHPLRVIQRLGAPGVAWESLLEQHTAEAAPWWRGGKKKRARKEGTASARSSTRRGGDIESKDFFVVSAGAPAGFYVPKGENGYTQLDAAAGHVVAILPTVTGIPLAFALGLQRDE